MILRGLTREDWEEQAELIHGSLSTWYRTRLNSAKFGEDAGPFRVFPELYEGLDPGCCLVAQEVEGGAGRRRGRVHEHRREAGEPGDEARGHEDASDSAVEPRASTP